MKLQSVNGALNIFINGYISVRQSGEFAPLTRIDPNLSTHQWGTLITVTLAKNDVDIKANNMKQNSMVFAHLAVAHLFFNYLTTR